MAFHLNNLSDVTIDHIDDDHQLQVVSIGENCFASCQLTQFTIMGGKVTFGKDALSNNSKLKEIHDVLNYDRVKVIYGD